MKSVSINGVARVNLGKKFAKQLRNKEHVPCVIYGSDKSEPIHFHAHTNEFRKIVYTPEVFLIDITIGEKTITATMSDIQFHPVTDRIIHIDFIKVVDGKSIKVDIPVSINGNSIGVRNGGRLALNIRKLLVEALAENLPETIEIDISALKIGQSIRVSDISIDNVNILSNPNDVVVGVKTSRAAVSEEDEGDVEDGTTEGDGDDVKEKDTSSEKKE